MRERAEIRYEYELHLAYIRMSDDVRQWKNRRDIFETLYAVGWIVGKTEDEIDEDFSEAICRQLEHSKVLGLRKAG